MKSILLCCFVIGICAAAPLLSQTILHPWHVVDNGGARSSGGGLLMQASIGQSATASMSASGSVLESGYIPGLRYFSGSLSVLDLSFESGWNMVSVPFIVPDYRKTTLYPGASSHAYTYDGTYVSEDTLKNGFGYWVKFLGPVAGHFSGTGIIADTVPVIEKWNMIGCLAFPILVSGIHPLDSTTLVSNWWGYSPASGYFGVDTLKPGRSYWIKAHNAGRLALQSGSATNLPAGAGGKIASRDGVNVLTVRDARGTERVIYYVTGHSSIDPRKWEVPQVPFDGMADVRFSTNRLLETADPAQRKNVAIVVTSESYPLTISWNSKSEHTGARLVIGTKELALDGTGTARVPDAGTRIMISLAPSSGNDLPVTYALHQNYPNPFNPTTTIRYDLPQQSHVRIVVYDAIGREVRVVTGEVQDAGFKAVEWNGVNDNGLQVASGVYFYRIETTPVAPHVAGFTDVRKMLLLR